ncbi:hypothetical protein RCL1_003669 [Eukaryota sp. TZLM3-RCL]
MPLFERIESELVSQTLFRKMDVDGDKYIKFTDLRVIYQSIGLFPTNTELKQILKDACDTDSNNPKMSFSTFRKLRTERSLTDFNILTEFKKFDCSELYRGFITPESIQDVLWKENWPEDLIIEAVRQIMLMDNNGDSKVSFQNFYDHIKGNIPAPWLFWLNENLSRNIPTMQIKNIMTGSGFDAETADNLIEKTLTQGPQTIKQSFTDYSKQFVHIIRE